MSADEVYVVMAGPVLMIAHTTQQGAAEELAGKPDWWKVADAIRLVED